MHDNEGAVKFRGTVSGVSMTRNDMREVPYFYSYEPDPNAPEVDPFSNVIPDPVEDPALLVQGCGNITSVGIKPQPCGFTDWQMADQTTGTATGTLNELSVSLVGTHISSGGVGSTLDGSATVFSGSEFTPPLARSDALEIRGAPETYAYTLRFSAPVVNPVLELASLASTLRFPAGTRITRLSGSPGFTVSGSDVSGTLTGGGTPNDSSGTVQLRGAYESISFTATAPGYIDGIYVQVGTQPRR